MNDGNGSEGKEGLKGVSFVLLACLLWAMDTLLRYPLLSDGVSATKIVFYEHLLLTLFSLPILYRSYRKFLAAPAGQLFSMFMVGGMGSALATLAFTWAFTLLNPSLVILLQKFQPLVAIFLSRTILGEKLQGKFLFWASLCIAGGILISYPELKEVFSLMANPQQSFHQRKVLVGHLLAFVAVIGWGSATVYGKKLTSDGYSETEVMAGRFTVGFLCLIPYFFSMEKIYSISQPILGKVLVMIFLSGIFAMYLYYHGLRLIPARVGALAEMFFPLCAVVVNWIFLGVSLNPMQIFGGVLLCFGQTVIEWKRY